MVDVYVRHRDQNTELRNGGTKEYSSNKTPEKKVIYMTEFKLMEQRMNKMRILKSTKPES